MIEKIRERERDDLDEGLERAAYHCFEMQFWHRELHGAMQESMGELVQIQSDDAMESTLGKMSERLRETAVELFHHTMLLGDELDVLDREWPEAPVDRGAWHDKLRLLMAHVSCGDECNVSTVCECLGGMTYLAKHTMTMGGEVSLEEAL